MATISAVKRNCRKVVCIGRNYADHIKELNNTRPASPFFFLKPPSSILLPHSGPVLRPRGTTLHYEVELGVVIGAPLSNLRASDADAAHAAVAGYLVCIDLTARDLQEQAKRAGLPWTAAKGFDTFLPVSGLVPRARVPDPYAAELWLDVNGESRQRDATELMLFRIPRILSEISGVMALEEGDIVLTGTPKGVGPVQAGDVMTAGLRVGGEEVEEGRIEVRVEDRSGGFGFE